MGRLMGDAVLIHDATMVCFTKCIIPQCLIITPFGCPVDPDIDITYAGFMAISAVVILHPGF